MAYNIFAFYHEIKYTYKGCVCEYKVDENLQRGGPVVVVVVIVVEYNATVERRVVNK